MIVKLIHLSFLNFYTIGYQIVEIVYGDEKIVLTNP
jgi:hypothetical protein